MRPAALSLKRHLSSSALRWFRPMSSSSSAKVQMDEPMGSTAHVHVHNTATAQTDSKSLGFEVSTVSSPVSIEQQDATLLTDDLLEYTRTLMNGTPHHIIAYSGGIDSSVVAALVHQSKRDNESVTAVLGISAAVPSDQVLLAEQVATVIGVTLEKIPTTEGSDATYIENSGQACLACKTHLYSCLERIVDHAIGKRLYNGTNADDLEDPTRLGLIAADRFEVRSPLRGTTKEQVRLVGRHLGLPNWNYAASPCLRSRLAIGVKAIPQHLHRIEAAETYVRDWLELDATRNLRVRLLNKGRAMVEVEDILLDHAKGALSDWRHYFEEELGFESVDVRSFKSGSVAEVVPPPQYSPPIRHHQDEKGLRRR